MKTFDIKNLPRWMHILTGETFEVASPGGQRNVWVTVNATARVDVYVADNPDMKGRVLVGSSDGMFDCRFISTAEKAFVQFESSQGAVIYIATHAPTHQVGQSAAEKFTSVIPAKRRNTELDRMKQLMRLNEERRNLQMQAELARLRAEFTAKPPVQPDVIDEDEADAENDVSEKGDTETSE